MSQFSRNSISSGHSSRTEVEFDQDDSLSRLNFKPKEECKNPIDMPISYLRRKDRKKFNDYISIGTKRSFLIMMAFLLFHFYIKLECWKKDHRCPYTNLGDFTPDNCFLREKVRYQGVNVISTIPSLHPLVVRVSSQFMHPLIIRDTSSKYLKSFH